MSSPGFVEAQDPPPSYGSLYGKIKEAKQTSNTSIDFCSAVCGIIFGTIGCLVVLIISLAIPVAFIAIGVIYRDDCTVQPLIPIFLYVCGATLAVRNLIALFKRLTGRDGEESKIFKYFVIIIDLFSLVWFIAGSVWVFEVYPPEYYNVHLPRYCNHILYSFAFYMLVITYGFIIISLICAGFAAFALATTN